MKFSLILKYTLVRPLISALLLIAVLISGDVSAHWVDRSDRDSFVLRGTYKDKFWDTSNPPQRLMTSCYSHSSAIDIVRHGWLYYEANPDCFALRLMLVILLLLSLRCARRLMRAGAHLRFSSLNCAGWACSHSCTVVSIMVFAVLWVLSTDARVHNGFGTDECYYVGDSRAQSPNWTEIRDRAVYGEILPRHSIVDVELVWKHMALYCGWRRDAFLLGFVFLVLMYIGMRLCWHLDNSRPPSDMGPRERERVGDDREHSTKVGTSRCLSLATINPSRSGASPWPSAVIEHRAMTRSGGDGTVT